MKEKTMTNCSRLALLCFVLIASVGVALAQSQNAETNQNKDQAKDSAPDINGVWTGTWGVYNPAQGATPPKEICKKLDAKVERKMMSGKRLSKAIADAPTNIRSRWKVAWSARP